MALLTEKETANLYQDKNTHIGIIEFDFVSHPNQIFCSDPVARLFEWKLSSDHFYDLELIGNGIKTFEPYKSNYKTLLADFMRNAYDHTMFTIALSNGKWCFVGIDCLEKNPNGMVSKAVAAIVDITEDLKYAGQTKRLIAQTRDLMFKDQLTLLSNKDALFYEYGEHFGQKYDYFILVDIQDFRRFNDIYNHEFGDTCLRAFSKRVLQYMRMQQKGDGNLISVYRIYSAEFVFACKLKENQTIEEWFDLFLKYFDQPYLVENSSLQMTLTLSAVMINNYTLEELLHYTDQGMYIAKKNKKRYYVLNKEEEQSELLLKQQFSDTIKLGHVEPFAQLFYDLKTDRVIGCEFLIRMTIEGKMFFPDQFIPLAREKERLHELDKAMFVKGINYVNELLLTEVAQPGFIVSFNFDLQTLYSVNLLEFVKSVVESTIIPYDSILIELNEQNNISELLKSDVAKGLRALGVHLIIDDFSAGHSSITAIGEEQFDFIKFDHGFLWDAMDSNRIRQIFISLASVFESEGMKVIAEGIENIEHADFLRSNGVSIAQGYYFGRPCKLESFTELMKEERLKDRHFLSNAQ